jgi:hypothetical protein
MTATMERRELPSVERLRHEIDLSATKIATAGSAPLG